MFRSDDKVDDGVHDKLMMAKWNAMEKKREFWI